MNKRGIGRLVAAVPAAVAFPVAIAFSVCAVAQDAGQISLSQYDPSLPRQSWLSNGGDLANRNYSPLLEINTENVAHLKGVWRASLGDSGMGPQYSAASQPIVADGVMYVTTGANDVFALDIDTGTVKWMYAANLSESINTVCCGWVNRGVALGDGRIYQGQLDGRLVALDIQTGDVLWSVQAERWEDGFTITSAPLYFDGLVVTGFAGAELGVRGRIRAYDASDGSLVWTFYTIPGPGEYGHDTWPQDNEIWMHGGGTIWQTPAVDPQLGLVYFSTGNPGPDFNGNVRAGDNLFTSSVVALDIHSGEYRWHFQQVHHDLWDYDSATPVVLFDLEYEGRVRRGLVQTSKSGWAYILDRETGEPLVGIEEQPVLQEPRQATSPTQPVPVGEAFVPQSLPVQPEGFPPVNGGRIFTPYWLDFVMAKPGIGGGANWPPNSFDPATGILYVCASDSASVFRAWEIDSARPPTGDLYIGGEFGRNPMPSLGIFAAMDMHTNTIVWQQHWPGRCYSGSVATAGGIVFVGRNDGRFTALAADDGRPLWTFQTDFAINAPPTVFSHNGKQHIAVFAGGSVSIGGDRGNSVWLFSLDGDMEPIESPSVSASVPPAADGPANLANGGRVFETTCAFCHGGEGEGGHGGPSLSREMSFEQIRRIVSTGRNEMPAFESMLSPEHVRDVSGYVEALLGD